LVGEVDGVEGEDQTVDPYDYNASTCQIMPYNVLCTCVVELLSFILPYGLLLMNFMHDMENMDYEFCKIFLRPPSYFR